MNNLKTLMEACELNPRSLSLAAGLNPTAVRDMLEGRVRFPRYDTVKSLAKTLGTTPAKLMGDAPDTQLNPAGDALDDGMDILVEIIARLQETAEEQGYKLTPREFAAMTATIYNQLQTGGTRKKLINTVKPRINDLFFYEALKRKTAC